MAGNAGGCVGVKGMLAARKDQEKKEKRKKEPYQRWRLSPMCASSLEKGFPLAPGMMRSLHQEGFAAFEASFQGVGRARIDLTP